MACGRKQCCLDAKVDTKLSNHARNRHFFSRAPCCLYYCKASDIAVSNPVRIVPEVAFALETGYSISTGEDVLQSRSQSFSKECRRPSRLSRAYTKKDRKKESLFRVRDLFSTVVVIVEEGTEKVFYGGSYSDHILIAFPRSEKFQRGGGGGDFS